MFGKRNFVENRQNVKLIDDKITLIPNRQCVNGEFSVERRRSAQISMEYTFYRRKYAVVSMTFLRNDCCTIRNIGGGVPRHRANDAERLIKKKT